MNYKHGMTGTPTYHSWCGMIQRCENPNNSRYKDWGGRGIKICERWHDFRNFFVDMGVKSSGLTLDRINNDGNYEPDNCKWATRKKQNNNKRPNSYCGLCPQRWFKAWHKNKMREFISNNQNKFAKQHKLSLGNINQCLHRKRKQHKGWKFCYI